MNPSIDFPHVADVAQQMRHAMEETTDEKARSALRCGLDVLQSLSSAQQSDLSLRYDGSIEHDFEDHDTGQSIKVRVFYNWTDYNRADEPNPLWGATVEDLQVIGVSNIDRNGDSAPLHSYFLDAAWNRMQEEMELIRGRCTEDGYHRGLGEAPFSYRPYGTPAPTSSQEFASRMVSSMPTRTYEDREQRSG